MDLSNQFYFLDGDINTEIFENPLEKLADLDSIIDTNKKLCEKVRSFFSDNNTDVQVRNKFFEKFDKILYEPMLKALGPENTKNWLLEYEKNLSKAPDNTDDQSLTNARETVIHNINSAFSNNWWDSDEKKIKAMFDLYFHCIDSNDVPKIITTYISFSVKALLKKKS